MKTICRGCSTEFEQRRDYTGHSCIALTDINGEVISLGDALQYTDGHNKVYVLVEAPAMWVKAGHGRGQCKNEEPRLVVTRLTRIVR